MRRDLLGRTVDEGLMGIERNAARFLRTAKERFNVAYDRTMMLGRQTLFLSKSESQSIFGHSVVGNGFADGLFAALGAQEILSLDASAYEGAQIIHDMNVPVPSNLQERFDVVFDGGTLEHVFNFPIALRNAMQMVSSGGHLILHTPANNYFGHGFYQFSPDLFYRALSPENGFMIRQMIACEMFPYGSWFEVPDPADVGGRIELASSQHRVLLMILAQRVAITEIFASPPQQSDYVTAWAAKGLGGATAAPTRQSSLVLTQMMRRVIGDAKASRLFDALYNKRVSLRKQPQLFRPVKSG
jgi:hypothetical protein